MIAAVRRRLKELLRASGIWHSAKLLLPKYGRPLLRLTLAKLGAGAVAPAYVELAKVRLYEEDLDSAIRESDKAAETDPSCADAYFLRGHALHRKGEAALAQAAYHRALSLAPGRADIQEACGNFEQAAELDPENAALCSRAGTTLRYTGQYARAEKLWGRGLALQRERIRRRGLDQRGVRFLGSSWFASFGHAGVIDYYIKFGLLGMRPPQKTYVALRPELRFPNRFMLEQWKPHVETVSDPAKLGLSWEDVDLLTEEFTAGVFPDGKARCWYLAGGALIEKQWEEQKRPPLLWLPEADAARGREALAKLGVPKDAWFATLHVRETGFWKQLDQSRPNTRGAEIETYFPAIRAITASGGWVIRLGDSSMKPLPKMERVVDYAQTEAKSDWMDVFLLSRCRFFVGLNSGPAFIPPAFGVPCALTNWSPVGIPSWYGRDVWIPKLYRSNKDGRFMALDEVFKTGLALQDYERPFTDLDASLVDNTPEEIEALVLEMLGRVEGKASYTDADNERQARFERLVQDRGEPVGRARVGRDFLRRHAWMLEAAQQKQTA